MGLYKQNYQAINLPVGAYTEGFLGDGLSATTIHELFCLADGAITITPKGGGTFTWSATTSQNLNVIVGNCEVLSGSFVGFKAHKGAGPYRI